MSKLRLDIGAETAASRYVRRLRRQIRRAHALLRYPLREISLAIVCAREMSAVHKRFLNRAGPTDVLSFALEHDRRGRVAGGEIVVCLDVARRQARLRRHRISDELLLYAVHGLLHLSGWDDRTKPAFAAMHAMEDQILLRLGVGPVFSSRSR